MQCGGGGAKEVQARLSWCPQDSRLDSTWRSYHSRSCHAYVLEASARLAFELPSSPPFSIIGAGKHCQGDGNPNFVTAAWRSAKRHDVLPSLPAGCVNAPPARLRMSRSALPCYIARLSCASALLGSGCDETFIGAARHAYLSLARLDSCRRHPYYSSESPSASLASYRACAHAPCIRAEPTVNASSQDGLGRLI